MSEQYYVLARPLRAAADEQAWGVVRILDDFNEAMNESARLESPKIETQVCAASAMRTPVAEAALAFMEGTTAAELRLALDRVRAARRWTGRIALLTPEMRTSEAYLAEAVALKKLSRAWQNATAGVRAMMRAEVLAVCPDALG